uniref:PX domain-containing protein n=1 Tax=Oryctolagus cuniculus TaxID=9986 RepID=G1SXQ2_RABIT
MQMPQRGPAAAVLLPAGPAGQGHGAGGARPREEGPLPEACVEYEVSSQRFQASVYRRYNDFVVFREVLLHKFPYRLVPALPPKRMLGADRECIEGCRRALKRFLNLVAQHPPLCEDGLPQLFLCFSGPDVPCSVPWRRVHEL